jgi:hypothetical protein
LAGALAAIALVSLPLIVLLVALGGVGGPAAMVHSVSYQFTRGSMQSVWGALGVAGAQPFGQACVLGLIAASVVWLRQQPHRASDRRRMAALCAAILIGLQLSADYWAFLYLAWVMPLIGASVLAGPAAAEVLGEPTAAAAGGLEPVGALAG